MASCLLAEHRHRCNQRTSELRRPWYPKLGMYDTWIIDALQIVLGANRGTLLLPEWCNTSEFAPTPESFGTVPLQSASLSAAIERIVLPEEVKLTRELAFIAKAMGCKLPPLPVTGAKECALFNRLVLLNRGAKFDFEQLAIDWCKYVNPGEGIFPKLPVYLRLHHAECERNMRVRNAVIAASAASKQLDQLNCRTAPAPRPASPPAPALTPSNLQLAPTVALVVAAPAHSDGGVPVAIARPLTLSGSAPDRPLTQAWPLARALTTSHAVDGTAARSGRRPRASQPLLALPRAHTVPCANRAPPRPRRPPTHSPTARSTAWSRLAANRHALAVRLRVGHAIAPCFRGDARDLRAVGGRRLRPRVVCGG